MQIYGPASLHGPQSVSAPHNNRPAQPAQPSRAVSGSDEVHISSQADMASRLADIPDIRQDRVQAIRNAIADGTYETGDKMGVALDRLLDEIA